MSQYMEVVKCVGPSSFLFYQSQNASFPNYWSVSDAHLLSETVKIVSFLALMYQHRVARK